MESESSLLDDSKSWTEGVILLKSRARWIRDELDPEVARHGPNALHSDDVLALDSFLRCLSNSTLSEDQLLHSRIHLAILIITGRATRWPKLLIDRCEAIESIWQENFGRLSRLPILLYEPGGRLHGICEPGDMSDADVKRRWTASVDRRVDPFAAQKTGHLGFTPGDWWISALFAFHDGIISDAETTGKITADDTIPYAVLLSGNDEIESDTPDSFIYRTTASRRERYRLSSSPGARTPIRVLRSHDLKSFWAPRAGVRYDGLYQVTGWSIRTNHMLKDPVLFDIRFKRCPNQIGMNEVLKRPWIDEVEDYIEYKRQRAAWQNDPPAIPLEPLEFFIPQYQDQQSGFDGADGSKTLFEPVSQVIMPYVSRRLPLGSLFREVEWKCRDEQATDSPDLFSLDNADAPYTTRSSNSNIQFSQNVLHFQGSLV